MGKGNLSLSVVAIESIPSLFDTPFGRRAGFTCVCGVDSAWEQDAKRPESTLREMLKNAAESPAPAARYVSPLLRGISDKEIKL
jgi:hypothetical protein